MTRGGGPGVAGLWQSAWPGVQRGAHVEQVARGWLRAVPPGLFPGVGDSFVPPLKAVVELRGVVGRLRGLTWGGAGWRSCCHCHRHCHLAALQPPSAGRVCPPFPAGLLGDGTVAVDVELAVWQCQPCCARARSLAAAPLPGLPSCLSSLVTNPSFDPRSQDPTNPGCAGEKTDTERAQRDLALQMGAAWQRSSRAGWDTLPALPSSFWFFSTPPRTFGSGIFSLESLLAVLEMAPRVPGSPRWWTALPWHQAHHCGIRWDFLQPECPHCCHIPTSYRDFQMGWEMQDGFSISWRKMKLPPCSSPVLL